MNVKILRNQVRIAVKELLPEVLKEALLEELQKRLNAKMDTNFQRVGEHVKTTLDQIDNRAKDVHSLMVRQAMSLSPEPTPLPIVTEEPTTEATQK